jgi:uncharacterized protein YndB with AHSA1/START domain
MADHVATAETEISASPTQVWAALTDPERIKRFMFGSEVRTDWRQGSPITWRGVYDGKEYEDKGEILEIEPQRWMKVTHFSPLSGRPDVPENYHTLTDLLEERGNTTHVSLSQDNNASEEEAEHSQGMWETLTAKVKELAEQE